MGLFIYNLLELIKWYDPSANNIHTVISSEKVKSKHTSIAEEPMGQGEFH